MALSVFHSLCTGMEQGRFEELDDEPTPEFATQMTEEMHVLLKQLDDDELPRIAAWKMEGCTSIEIAQRLGKALAMIERRLKLIRTIWSEVYV